MNTFLALVVMAIALAALGRWKRIFPHRPLVLAVLAPALLSTLLVVAPGIFWWLIGIDVLIAGLVLADLFTLPRAREISAERQCGQIASLRKAHRVTLTITNHGRRDRVVWVRDGAEADLAPDPDQFLIVLHARSRSIVHYDARPDRRGRFVLTEVYMRVRSRFGFWQRYLASACTSHIHVYPDMKQLGEYAVLARTNRLSLMGVRRTRKIGQDNEFERLRDYTPDDNYKHIDWRSTARRNRLTVKDFQANQSQRIIFLVDCGRMMTNESAGLSLLDHALNAVLMLSFVALRQGDQVGLLCFSDEIHTFVPPGGGTRMMNRLLHASFDRFPQMVESRYDEAFLYLAAHCRKRALVVLVTNVIDEVNAHQIKRYLGTLVGRHLPLGVLLRDHRLFEAVDLHGTAAENSPDEQLFPAAAAADILTWRHQILADLETKGVLSLDVFPEQMTAPLVNRYLDIKARHLL